VTALSSDTREVMWRHYSASG